MKKVILLIVCVIIMLTAFVGCGADETKFSELEDTTKLSLTLVNDGGWYTGTRDAFKRKNPAVALEVDELSIDRSSKEEYYQAAAAKIMAGKGADIVIIDQLLLSSNDINKMIKAGAFADMAEIIESDTSFKMDNLFMTAIDKAKTDGGQYIMPMSYHMPLFFSTEESLAFAGIDKTQLDNSDNLINELTSYYSKYEEEEAPLLFSWFVPTDRMLKYMGVNLLDFSKPQGNSDVKSVTDTPLFKKGVEFWRTVYSAEWDSTSIKSPELSADILISEDNKSGEFAMLFDNLAFYKQHISLLESLDKAGTPIVVPWRGSDGKISVFLSEGLAISSNSKNVKNAWEFIKLCLDADLQVQKSAYGIPINRAVIQSEFPKASLKSCEDYAAFQDDIGKMYFHSRIDNEINGILKEYGKGETNYDVMVKRLEDLLFIYLSE